MTSRRTFAVLLPHLARYRRGYAWGALALLVGIAFQLGTPIALRRAVDGVGQGGAGTEVLHYSLLYLALAGGHAVFRFLSRLSFLGNARRVEHDLRAAYFTHLVRLPARHIETGRKGDFTSRATHDLLDIRLFLGTGLLNFLQTTVLLLCAAVLLWRIHPGLTAVALSPLPLISVLVRWHSPRLHRRYRDANRRAGELSAGVQEALDGLRILRTYGREEWQQEHFSRRNRALRNAHVRVITSWTALYPAVGVLAGLGHVAVLGWGGRLVYLEVLTLGEFVAFNAYLAMLTWPMIALGWTLSLVQRSEASLQRLGEVMEQPLEPDGPERLPPDSTAAALACSGVSFRHPGTRHNTLQHLDFSVPDGCCWGLVGATGSGKSTLVELLSRVRRPDSGQIRLRNTDLAAVANSELRRELAVVPQNGFFFSAGIADNVCLGRPRDPDRLRWALSTAGLLEELEGAPAGLQTVVGEGGITLSGGQRQRLALARALYGRPNTLILDSCFSSLDAVTARRVLHNLRGALPGATLLMVSHRGAEVEGADGVLFLHRGTIAARGTHLNLLGTNPDYLRLYREEELRRELLEAAP